ncbi:transposase [Streptomyces phaeofaciens]|uniref:transposase n=1 Tax=Streptomyces phaeofaciens TaxID=68254 RepID=UPI0036D19EA5
MRPLENALRSPRRSGALDTESRRIACTANAIESVNARIRRAVKARGHLPDEQAALKCAHMATMSLDLTGKGQARWTMPGKAALDALDMTFDGRPSAARQRLQPTRVTPRVGQTRVPGDLEHRPGRRHATPPRPGGCWSWSP